jgi:hypothetical protein
MTGLKRNGYTLPERAWQCIGVIIPHLQVFQYACLAVWDTEAIWLTSNTMSGRVQNIVRTNAIQMAMGNFPTQSEPGRPTLDGFVKFFNLLFHLVEK